jgi:hypothetical protein
MAGQHQLRDSIAAGEMAAQVYKKNIIIILTFQKNYLRFKANKN